MIDISQLLVGHNYLRKTDFIEGMIKFVRGGGRWTQQEIEKWACENGYGDTKPIYITRFEDGQLFIHDGHHRCVATLLGGRDTLYEEECRVKDWKYEDYLKVDFLHGFVTPFDVKNECRLADFCEWKDRVLAMYREGSEDLAMDEIKNGSHNYCEPRINTHVRQLAAEYQRLHKSKPKGIIRASGVARTVENFEARQGAANDVHLNKIVAIMQRRNGGRELDARKIGIMGDVIAESVVPPSTVPVGQENGQSPLPPVGRNLTALREAGAERVAKANKDKSLTKKQGSKKADKPPEAHDI